MKKMQNGGVAFARVLRVVWLAIFAMVLGALWASR